MRSLRRRWPRRQPHPSGSTQIWRISIEEKLSSYRRPSTTLKSGTKPFRCYAVSLSVLSSLPLRAASTWGVVRLTNHELTNLD